MDPADYDDHDDDDDDDDDDEHDDDDDKMKTKAKYLLPHEKHGTYVNYADNFDGEW